MRYGDVKLYAGTACPDLAGSIAEYLDQPLCARDIVTFPNDNMFVKLHTSVRGQDCYVIQTTSSPGSPQPDGTVDHDPDPAPGFGCPHHGCCPYLCYARSDKKDQPRVPITARLVADMIEVAGADRYITLDLHAGQIQGFFSIPGDVLTAFYILMDYLKAMKPQMLNPVVVTADLGFAKKARNYAAGMDVPLAFIEKRRGGQRFQGPGPYPDRRCQ